MKTRNRQQHDIKMIFAAKIGDNILNINKRLVAMICCYPEKIQNEVEGNSIFSAKSFY